MSNLNFPWRTLRLCPPVLSETSPLFVPAWGRAGTESPCVTWGTGSGAMGEGTFWTGGQEAPGGEQGRRQWWAWGELQTRALQGAPQWEQSAEQPGPRGSPARVTRSSARSPSETGVDRGSAPPSGSRTATSAIEPVRATWESGGCSALVDPPETQQCKRNRISSLKDCT